MRVLAFAPFVSAVTAPRLVRDGSAILPAEPITDIRLAIGLEGARMASMREMLSSAVVATALQPYGIGASVRKRGGDEFGKNLAEEGFDGGSWGTEQAGVDFYGAPCCDICEVP